MAKSIGSVYIDIEARTAKLEEGVEKAQKSLKGMQDKLAGTGKLGADALDALGFKFLKFNLYAQASANAVQALGAALSSVMGNADLLLRGGIISPQAATNIDAATMSMARLRVAAQTAFGDAIADGSELVDVLRAAKLAAEEYGPLPGARGRAISRMASGYAFDPIGLQFKYAAKAEQAVLGEGAGALSDVEARAVAAAGGMEKYRAEIEKVHQATMALNQAEVFAGKDRAGQLAMLDAQIASQRKQLEDDAKRTTIDATDAERERYEQAKEFYDVMAKTKVLFATMDKPTAPRAPDPLRDLSRYAPTPTGLATYVSRAGFELSPEESAKIRAAQADYQAKLSNYNAIVAQERQRFDRESAEYAKALAEFPAKMAAYNASMVEVSRAQVAGLSAPAALPTKADPRLSELGTAQAKARMAQLEAQRNAIEKTANEQALAAIRTMDEARRRAGVAEMGDLDKLNTLLEEKARLESIVTEEKIRSKRFTVDEYNAYLSQGAVITQIGEVKGAIARNARAQGLAAAQAELQTQLSMLSGEEKLATMANARYRLEEKLASIKDTGERGQVLAQINALRSSEEGERYAALERQKVMLEKYETARAGYAKAELTDSQKLADIQAKLAESRAKVDVTGLLQAGVVLNKEQTAEYEKQIALMQELNATHARVYASDADVMQAQNALAKARTADTRKALTDEEERATILREIAVLEERISAAKAGGGQLTKEQLESMREAAKLYERNAELIEKNHQKMEQFGESLLSTFSNGIMQARDLSDIFKDLLNQIAQYFIQQALIKPLAQQFAPMFAGMFGSLGTMFGGAGAGNASGIADIGGGGSTASVGVSTGFALGGHPGVGRQVLVGEKGPELATFSSAARVDTAQRTQKLLAGSASQEPAFTYAPVYNVAAGVTEKELIPILRSHAEMVRSSITNDLVRGGRRAAQFAR